MVVPRLIGILGGPVVRTGLVIEGCLGLLLWKRWRPAIFLAATVSATGALNSGLKKMVDRRRPRSLAHPRPDTESFPSGHASGTTALLGAWVYILWLLTRKLPVVAGASLAGVGLAGTVGYSRVRLHRHHTGDVLAGHALGAGCLLVAISLERHAPKQVPW